MPPLEPLLALDRSLTSTWQAYERALRECLSGGDRDSGLALIAAIARDAWLSVDSDYYPLAATLLVRAGKIDEALGVVREARRLGFRRFFYFDPAWGSQGIARTPGTREWTIGGVPLPKVGFELHELLEPVYEREEITAFVRASFRPTVEPWGFDIHTTPLCWGEETVLKRRSAKCAITGQRLAAGEDVYQFRFFNGSFDVPTEFFFARPAAFTTSGTAFSNRRKFELDEHALSEFNFKVGYGHPLVNAFWYDLESFDLRKALSLIVDAAPCPTPYALGKIGDPAPTVIPRHVFAGCGGELVDLLWVLVKCGHVREFVAMLPELPRHFALLLLLFDRPALRREVAAWLGLPELATIYELLAKGASTSHDRAALVRFGQRHPEFQELLAQSLTVYEYHLYSNYQCCPNWFFQDFRNLVSGRGRAFVYLLASRPDLLAPLGAMRATQKIVQRPDTTVSGIAYEHIAGTFVEVMLLHGLLTGSPDVAFWESLCDADVDGCGEFQKAGRSAQQVAKLLGLARRKKPARKAEETSSDNAWVTLATTALEHWVARGQIELTKKPQHDLVEALADVLAASASPDQLEAFLLSRAEVAEIFATGPELARAIERSV